MVQSGLPAAPPCPWRVWFSQHEERRMTCWSSASLPKIMGGSLISKSCGLGPAGFPHGHRCVAASAVSLYGHAAVLPQAGLDYHLVHTLILIRPLANSLGIFFDNTPFPSLFCRWGFRSHRPRHLLASVRRGFSGPWAHCFIRLIHSRQATLHPAPHHVSVPHAGVHCSIAMLLTWCNRHSSRPPRKEGRRPHAIADRPSVRQRRAGARLAVSPA